jgi:hypothetical protein
LKTENFQTKPIYPRGIVRAARMRRGKFLLPTAQLQQSADAKRTQEVIENKETRGNKAAELVNLPLTAPSGRGAASSGF